MAANELLHRYIASRCQSACSEQVADLVIQLWEALAAELIPIIGEYGFTALYTRNLHLAQSSFPWLVAGQTPPADSLFLALRASLEGRSPTEAGEAVKCQLSTFVDLLALLIGEPLTTSMLHAAWGLVSSETGSTETGSSATVASVTTSEEKSS